MKINDREIGYDKEPYIVAELSCNHCGSIDLAKQLIRESHEAGADAVKIQAYDPHSLTIPGIKIEGGKWDGRTYFDLYEQTQTPLEWIPVLFEFARKEGITLISSVFCERGLLLLEACGCPAYKVASFEAADGELLRKIGSTGKPVIMSLGAVDDGEALESTMLLKAAGAESVALLHCVSEYPALHPHLSRIHTLRSYFNSTIPIGFSDHSRGRHSMSAGAAAVAAGACIIERHVALNEHKSEDDGWSISSLALGYWIDHLRTVWNNMHVEPEAQDGAQRFARSIYCVKDIAEGERFTRENVRVIRPGYGLHPRVLLAVLGSCATQDVERGQPITIENTNLFGGEA